MPVTDDQSLTPPGSDWVCAGCKLNLFLHINHRRDDGYHELQTYFQLLDYGDELEVQASEGDQSGLAGRILVEWFAGDEDTSGRPARASDDLLVRAALALREHVRTSSPDGAKRADRLGAHIVLRKHMPVGGGLGGGSASAAKLLLELNRLWALDLPIDELESLGAKLGADVPVFIRGESALAEGIGDVLRPAAVRPLATYFLVLVPDVSAHTADLFAHPNLLRDTPKQDDACLLSNWQTQGENVFQPLVLADNATLQELHDRLRERAGFARMTGSGTCLFAPVASRAQGESIGREILDAHPALLRFFVAAAKGAPNQSVT